MCGVFRFPFLISTVPAGTAQFGQADLSKTEAHTEAPMTQQGCAAAPGSIIDHVWFVKNLSELERQRTETKRAKHDHG